MVTIKTYRKKKSVLISFEHGTEHGSLRYPPANFTLDGSKGYLFFRGQPAFCRGCLKYGHQAEGCEEMECKNCLGKGHLARNCQNPRRCRSCGGEGHLAHSSPSRTGWGREATVSINA
uniref:CCHC-type domain-containing protein n=1 Tax=Astyanax mexicanus TaxID=7994 RepID=A0A3B1IHD1_ASTMX